jgi:hypothetical protein
MADDMTGGGLDPLSWFLSIFAGANPEKAGPLLDAAGVPPPGKFQGRLGSLGGPDLNSLLNPEAMPATPTDMGLEPSPTGIAQPMAPAPQPAIDPASWGANVSVTGPQAAAPAAAQSPLLAKMAGLQGVKAPEPIKPIMTGGVTGGVKAPEVQVGGAAKAMAPAIAALMAASRPAVANPLRVPALADLLKGRGGY